VSQTINDMKHPIWR